jgi:hypothetical protein
MSPASDWRPTDVQPAKAIGLRVVASAATDAPHSVGAVRAILKRRSSGSMKVAIANGDSCAKAAA